MADEQAALLAQIAALSGAIKNHKSSSSSAGTTAPAQPQYWASSSRGATRGRGASRGGRGAAATSGGSRNRSLVISQQPNSGNAQAAAGSSSTQAAPEAWVQKKSTHNMSLVSASTFERTEPARLAALAASSVHKPVSSSSSSSKPASSSKRKATAGVRRGDNMGEVIIDGVTFVFDSTGTKLVKAASQPAPSSEPSTSALPTEATAATDATPLRTNVNGQRFIRTKNGNLISAELLHKRKEDKLKRARVDKLDKLSRDVAQRERLRGAGKAPNKTLKDRKPKGLCSFFNTTGRCQRGLSCPFTHDVTRLAICRGALRPTGCTLPRGTCLLSHKASPERAPHCMHYLNARACRNGDACLYTHPSAEAGVGPTTPACAEFQRVGWCAAGKECRSRHTWECPDFARDGKCERKGCRLQHVIRAGAGAGKDALDEVDYLYVPPTGDLDDGDLFVRDDAAASLSFEQLAAEDAAFARRKREREGESEEEEEGTSFKPRRKKAKEFTEQKDYIGFGDEESESESSSSEEEEEEGSVHSDEDMDLSEGDSEGVEDMQVSEGEEPELY